MIVALFGKKQFKARPLALNDLDGERFASATESLNRSVTQLTFLRKNRGNPTC